MPLPANSPVEGFDFSNFQGPMATSDVHWARAAGKSFVIIRLSTEDIPRRALTIQQVGTFKAERFPTFGYAWCYWGLNPRAAMDSTIALARECGVSVVALNFEDDPIPGVDPVAWLQAAADQLALAGITPIGCTFTDWPHRHSIDLSPLGSLPWWVENKAGHLEFGALEFYPGAVVIGQQWGEGAMPGARAHDADVFVFPAEMAAQIDPEEGEMLTEADVRRIVREEVGAMVSAAGQGSDLSVWVAAVTLRLRAAGRALDVEQPVPGSQP